MSYQVSYTIWFRFHALMIHYICLHSARTEKSANISPQQFASLLLEIFSPLIYETEKLQPL
jgi:hypothetical protein